VNGAYRGDDEIGKLMHDFSCPNPDDMMDEDLSRISRYYKETQEGVEAMCKAMEDMRNEAKLETSREIAEKLIAKGTMSYEDIAEITGLSLNEVEKLACAEPA
jgi:predicted transposase/invertase (TIGR01784 family)